MADLHPSLLKRKIIHVDMDAFFASVEIRDNPALRGRPIVVGGSPTSRGVVSTASYEARKFGIRSAMPCSRAAALCPQAIFLPPRFDAYCEVSRDIRKIFSEYSNLVEPMSLDEAYIDVTNNPQGLYAVKIAQEIRRKVFEVTSLTCSVGVAPNKLVAKIASDVNKPNGITVVLPEQVEAFMKNLPMRKISGIGPVSEKKLESAGIRICCDLWKYSQEELEDKFDHWGEWLWYVSRGIDERPVESFYIRKSLGKEETYPTDILDIAVVISHIKEIAAEVADSLVKKNIKGRTITLKIKYADFTQITRSQSIEAPTNDVAIIEDVAKTQLSKTEVGKKKVRLIGVSVSNLDGETTTLIGSDDEDD